MGRNQFCVGFNEFGNLDGEGNEGKGKTNGVHDEEKEKKKKDKNGP